METIWNKKLIEGGKKMKDIDPIKKLDDIRHAINGLPVDDPIKAQILYLSAMSAMTAVKALQGLESFSLPLDTADSLEEYGKVISTIREYDQDAQKLDSDLKYEDVLED